MVTLTVMSPYRQFNSWSVPYGVEVKYDEKGKKLLVEPPNEQKIIAAARDLYRSGLSLEKTAEALKIQGMRPRKEQETDQFHPTQIARMLDQKRVSRRNRR